MIKFNSKISNENSDLQIEFKNDLKGVFNKHNKNFTFIDMTYLTAGFLKGLFKPTSETATLAEKVQKHIQEQMILPKEIEPELTVN